MTKAGLIAGTFDLQRRHRLCNIRGCGRQPSRRVTLYEEDRITRARKTLATLYLCTLHNEARMPTFMTEMNVHRETGKLIGRKVQETGFVTY